MQFKVDSASYMVAGDGTKYLTRPIDDVIIEPEERKIFDVASQLVGIAAGDYRLSFVVKEFSFVSNYACREFAWSSATVPLP